MIYYIFIGKYFLFQFQQKIKQWAKPVTLSLISGFWSNLTRSHSDLIVENALLRQQLHDWDSKYVSRFAAVATGSGIQELRTPYRAPRANGV